MTNDTFGFILIFAKEPDLLYLMLVNKEKTRYN
jgi:hypothetical protein